MRLGLLDVGDMDLQQLVELAQEIELRGYSRLWLAEHHPGSLYSNTAIMTTVMAGTTERIRIGPAGVLLRFQAPYAVADSALLLERLFPRRIDFGLAAGTARPEIELLLADGRTGTASAEWFDRKASEVLRLARTRVAAERHEDRRRLPMFWVLGSTGSRASLAGQIGAAYSLSVFHRDTLPSPDTLRIYFEAFERGGHTHPPQVNVAIAVGSAGVPASRFTASFARSVIAGKANECEEQIRAIADRYGADEVILLDTHADFSRRREMLVALADRFSLQELAQ